MALQSAGMISRQELQASASEKSEGTFPFRACQVTPVRFQLPSTSGRRQHKRSIVAPPDHHWELEAWTVSGHALHILSDA